MALNTPVCDFGWRAVDFELEDTSGFGTPSPRCAARTACC
jgi:hypothetical protein